MFGGGCWRTVCPLFINKDKSVTAVEHRSALFFYNQLSEAPLYKPLKREHVHVMCMNQPTH